ncbi:MAG: phosphotransferase [Candidatus Sulfopaludibacter sp.]|nr:phosphotransferase [Candidatus Sulfopaludibacter sp.]
MIPPEKSDAVFRGLREAFGTTTIEDIRRLAKGLSSDLVFRIVVRGTPFLLRINTRMDERNDPVRVFTCMKAAAEAGLAPRVLYSKTEDGIAIIDFIEAVDFPSRQALVLLPRTLRKLHALPPFPKAFNYVTAHNFFIWKLRTADLLPHGETEQVFRRYEQICAAYPRLDADLVSCHMDLKPENILFDGCRIWLVDWMAASLNDRYFDLAIVANFVVTSDADERTYLEEYLGPPPDEYQRARFFLMCPVVHMFAAAVFLLLGSAGKPIRQSENPPSFRDFHERIWAGEIDLADNDLKIVYAMVHWDRLLQNVRQPRFDEALRIVSERNTSQEGVRLLLPSAP